MRAESYKREAQAAGKAADEKLAKGHSDANELVELRKRQAALDVSVQELTADLKEINSQLVKVVEEKL